MTQEHLHIGGGVFPFEIAEARLATARRIAASLGVVVESDSRS